MPTLLLLEGDDLPALLQRVRDELGPEAVVVKADRVRTGGVAGFFAKEHFEVTVEVPDVPPTRRARRLAEAHASAGIQALLAAADASDDADGDSHQGGPSVTDAVPADGDTFAALLASIDGGVSGTASPGVPAPREPQDRPLTTAATSSGATDAVAGPPAARLVDTGVAVTAASFEPLHPVGDAQPPTPPTAPAPHAGSAPPAAPSAAPGPSTATSASRAGVQPAMFARLPAGTPTTRDAAAARAARRGEDATAVGTSPTTAPDAAEATSVLAPAVAAGDARRVLADLGIPATLLGEPTGDALAALPGVLGRLPRPPSVLRAPGSLVVLVGEGAEVVTVAREMARRAGLDPQDVALAGDLRPADATDREVLTPATAPRQRSRTSTLGAVTLVAVSVGPGRDDRQAAAALLDALDPDQCWALVDARRKSADLRAWMADVAGGRRFAGVAGSRVEETCEPGTLLDLGVPVGWLDRQPVTPAVWAAVLGERLDGGAHLA